MEHFFMLYVYINLSDFQIPTKITLTIMHPVILRRGLQPQTQRQMVRQSMPYLMLTR